MSYKIINISVKIWSAVNTFSQISLIKSSKDHQKFYFE